MADQIGRLVPILRALRARLGLTQEQLAERLGVSFATVNRWEGGTAKPQRAAREAILALAQEAGVANEGATAVVPRRTQGRRRENESTQSMEQMLWNAACSIRGEKDAGKF